MDTSNVQTDHHKVQSVMEGLVDTSNVQTEHHKVQSVMEGWWIHPMFRRISTRCSP